MRGPQDQPGSERWVTAAAWRDRGRVERVRKRRAEVAVGAAWARVPEGRWLPLGMGAEKGRLPASQAPGRPGAALTARRTDSRSLQEDAPQEPRPSRVPSSSSSEGHALLVPGRCRRRTRRLSAEQRPRSSQGHALPEWNREQDGKAPAPGATEKPLSACAHGLTAGKAQPHT